MVLRLEDNLDILQKSLQEIPRDPDDSSLFDIRGSLLLYYKTSSWASFGLLFGNPITIQNLIQDDCRFRLHQRHILSPLTLKFYHPTWKMCFKFKVSSEVPTKRFWKMHIQQVISELATKPYFQGMYQNTIFRSPDTVVLEKKRYEELAGKPDEVRISKNILEELKKKADRYDQHMYDVGQWSPQEDYTLLKEATTMVLMEEIERRYKAANPDWAKYLLTKNTIDTAEIIKLIDAA